MATVSQLPPLFSPAAGFRVSTSDVARRQRPALDLQRITWDALVIMALLLLNKGGNLGACAFFAILAVMVLTSPQAAFKALAIASLGVMLNTSFVPKSIAWTPARLALPLLAFVRFSFDLTRLGTTLLTKPTYVVFVAYVGVMAMCSVLSGWYSQIALIKLTNFWAVLSAIFAAVTVLRRMRVDMTEWFVSLIAAATLFGLLSIALGVDNNFRVYTADVASNAFVGAFLHPNCHSVYASLFVVFLAAVFLLGEYPRRRITVVIIAIWFVFMVWSKARASVAATLAGSLVLLVLAHPFRNRFGWRIRLNMRKSQVLAYLAGAAVLLGGLDLATRGGISKSVVAFVNKAGRASELETIDTEQVMASRQGLIDQSWKNFQERTLTGIGFQVATDAKFIANATLFTAPTEKGFLPTAVLEEGGVVGATAFVVFLLVFVSELYFSRSIPTLAVLSGFLMSNMAEVTMFSPGGSGTFGWIMIGAAMILGDHCWDRSRTLSGSFRR